MFSAPGSLPDQDSLLRLLADCVRYLAGVERISAKALAAAPNLRVISRNGTGSDGIDTDAGAEDGIYVCRALGPGLFPRPHSGEPTPVAALHQ
ncbi:MAG: hypothetical protein ACR2N9_07180 [Acidimicrobiia bacterium]